MADYDIVDGVLTFDIFRTALGTSELVVVDILAATLVIQEVAQLYMPELERGEPSLKFYTELRSMLVQNRVIPEWISVFSTGEIFTKVTEAGESLKKSLLWSAMSQPSTDSTPPS